MPGSAKSKPVNSRRLAASVAAANASAVQRAACGRPLPTSSATAPPRIGSHTSRLSSGKEPFTVISDMRSVPVVEQDAEQRDQPEDHREGVVVQEPGLGLAQQRRGGVDHPGAAVDEEAVDHLLVDLA